MGSDALRLALTQYGLLSREQGKTLGLSADTFRWLTRGGVWEPVLPGVIRLRGHPESWEQRLEAACLWGGPGCAVSHRAAAAWWGLRGFERGAVEITTTKNPRPVESLLVVHRQRALPEAIARERGIPVTSLLLTLMELGSVAAPELVEAALDDALVSRRASLRGLRWTLERHGGQGRRGAATLRRLLDARDPAHAPPEGELDRRFRRLLKSSDLPRPVEQYEIRHHGILVARVDFAYPDRGLVVETDGYAWHAGRLDWQHDRERDNALATMGWRVLRFTWTDVVAHPERVLDRLHAFFAHHPEWGPRMVRKERSAGTRLSDFH